MHGVALLLTVAAIGVDYGWQPGEDGQLEYIIQIEPELVKTLSDGSVDLLSEIPEELRHVKRLRIRIGTGPVPRKGLEESQAQSVQPGDNIASQPPNLNGRPNSQTDPRSAATRRPPDPRASSTQPGGRVLTPPGRATNEQDSTQPADGDRYTDTGGGGSFPAVDRTPGIGRSASLPRDRFGKAADPSDPTEPLDDRTPVEYDAEGNPRSSAPAPRPVWDSTTGQWRTPRNPASNTNPPATNGADPRSGASHDPRYGTDPRTGQPAQDPRAYTPYAPNSYPPSAYAQAPNQNPWAQPGYNPAPLRDPDQGYYPPSAYARQDGYHPNLPPNRQVGYQVATTAGTSGQPSASTPSTSSAPPAATPTANVKPVTPAESERQEAANKPYMPLTIVSMLFFASVGLNFYLGWIAHGIYQRYRALLMEVRNVRAAAI